MEAAYRSGLRFQNHRVARGYQPLSPGCCFPQLVKAKARAQRIQMLE
jgi:hypothetical protein